MLAALPETGVGSLRSSFMDMQARMRERLAESLSEQASARLENYERRHFALPPHSVGQLSIAAWELEAERSRLQRMLSQLDEHQWWSRLMYQLTSNNAQLTSEQQVVLFILKETIERGEPFGQVCRLRLSLSTAVPRPFPPDCLRIRLFRSSGYHSAALEVSSPVTRLLSDLALSHPSFRPLVPSFPGFPPSSAASLRRRRTSSHSCCSSPESTTTTRTCRGSCSS